ncbi:putative efflux protein (plasmid) [Selenomonas ruminantium subsp. lactilytica TAM6421]|uniref:Putative efflux protein n=1 Tax=Selenomonas ruminantium subsp. lactilytica (strain NBRC 103574 / TAM6421) TaxID=927704 RepID=I0GW47_SELRL|nr:ABC transporter permease [Selenomonas ruminantium]BAL84984.1 putative efflux protein [Selenomonas ruminantium subsp. lactilytica TAM6421]
MNSLRDELKFLFSGQGMPYEKVCLMVAMVITIFMSVILSGNIAKDAKVAIIDLDNSAYTRSLINRIEASEFMKVTAVLNTPQDPKELFYQDRAVTVVYFPQGLEKDRYTGTATNIGVFYDNTNTANTSNIKEALNEIIGLDNAAASGDVGSSNDNLQGSVSLAVRNLFNPQDSKDNGETLGFLLFFGSMFFTFATIGMIPRLRLSHQLDEVLLHGTPWDLLIRLLPYGFCLLVSWVVGLAILRVWGDLTFSGSLLTFLFVQLFFIPTVGALSLFFGWTAANPGIASSRMILFIPGGFILGGMTGPTTFFADWVVKFSHIFPLTWEFHFQRDIISRGAGLADISQTFGAFMVYMGIVGIIFCLRFYSAKKELLAQQAADQHKQQELQKLTRELTEQG